jgi:hypothetical protein
MMWVEDTEPYGTYFGNYKKYGECRKCGKIKIHTDG